MPTDRRTLLVALSEVTAFVVTVVVLAPFVNSQSLSISTGDRFWSIATIGAGVLAMVAVGTAAILARSRLRTAALTALAGFLIELPGLYDRNFEALSPVGAGMALGAVTVATTPRMRAATVAGTLVAVHVSDALLDPSAIPRRYADYLANDANQFQPPVAPATLTALALVIACVVAYWNHDFDKVHLKELMAMRPVTIAAILTLLGVAANWWFEITTVGAAVPLLLVALIVTVISARVMENGGRILLMSTAVVACLASVSANRPSTGTMEWSQTPVSTALFLGVVIVSAAAVGSAKPSRKVAYGILLVLTAAGIISYLTSPSPRIGDAVSISDVLVVAAAAAVTYAVVSAMAGEPPRTGASRVLVGLGVVFGPTALALLVYPQFDYGWTAYTPLRSFDASSDVVILDAMALLIVAVCAYASLRLGRIIPAGDSPVSRSDSSPPGAGTP